jgi:hypothetical protein
MDIRIAKGTVVTVRTNNGGELTLPLAFAYRPSYDVVLEDGTPSGVYIWAGRIRSVQVTQEG